jgi:hypothetical protein
MYKKHRADNKIVAPRKPKQKWQTSARVETPDEHSDEGSGGGRSFQPAVRKLFSWRPCGNSFPGGIENVFIGVPSETKAKETKGLGQTQATMAPHRPTCGSWMLHCGIQTSRATKARVMTTTTKCRTRVNV